MKRRDFSGSLARAAVAVPALAATGLAWGQKPALVPEEGRHFTLIPKAQPGSQSGKIEVIEFFSYACPACSNFEPVLEPWVRNLPKDVAFRRVPVHFLANAENFQRTYFALEVLGLVEAMQKKIFTAVHVEHANMAKPEDIAAVVARSGTDPQKFLAAFNSFSVAGAVGKAKATVNAYAIERIPTLAIHGRYLTSPGQAGGAMQGLAVADHLIARVRKG